MFSVKNCEQWEDGWNEEVGNVRDIFLNPQSETSRKLVFSAENKYNIKSEKKCIRIVFDGESSALPVFANLILETQVKLNILGANTEDIGGSAYGQLLIERPDDRTVDIIKKYLDKQNIKYEEVNISKQKKSSKEVA